jgi:hypothetical protein
MLEPRMLEPIVPRPTGKESWLIPFQFGFEICLTPTVRNISTVPPKINAIPSLMGGIFEIVSIVHCSEKVPFELAVPLTIFVFQTFSRMACLSMRTRPMPLIM